VDDFEAAVASVGPSVDRGLSMALAAVRMLARVALFLPV
jgi:hypothetical protein